MNSGGNAIQAPLIFSSKIRAGITTRWFH